jgi:SPP1 gp7 family putative phage head morphogenesis protein
MVVEAILVVTAYTDRLMRALEPLLQERYGQRGARLDALVLRQDVALAEVFEAVRDNKVSRWFLKRMFGLVDRQAANDLAHAVSGSVAGAGSSVAGSSAAAEIASVASVPLTELLPQATRLEAAFIERNVSLIDEERVRREVAAIIEAPIREGVRVEEIRAEIQERMGVVRSRAELIARDQTLKLYGQVQEERQVDAGIEEYVWSTSLDERVRSRHTELEGTTQRWDAPPVVDPRTGRREHPGGDFQCLPGGSRIGFSGPVNGAFRRRYAGELTQLVTDTGETLECTPNHPILTAAGWQPAKSIQVGDYVFATREHGAQLPKAHVEDSQPTVTEVFETLALAFGVTRPRSVATQFHGDTSVDEHVDVVDVDCGLRLDLEAAMREVSGQLDLPVSNSSAASLRKAEIVLERSGLAAHGGVGVLRLRLAQFFGRLGEACDVSGPAIARLHAITDKQIADGFALGAVALGQAFDGRACGLEFQAFFLGQWLRIMRRSVHVPGGAPISDRELADRLLVYAETGADIAPTQVLRAQRVRVVETVHRQFLGHVFNLSTDESWYVAQGILTHNCRCAAIPVLPTDGAPISETRPSVRAPTLSQLPENDV